MAEQDAEFQIQWLMWVVTASDGKEYRFESFEAASLYAGQMLSPGYTIENDDEG